MVAAQEGNGVERSGIQEGKLQADNKSRNRLISDTVHANAEESRRCRGCRRDLSIGQFDHDGQERLSATCRMCLVSDLLLKCINIKIK